MSRAVVGAPGVRDAIALLELCVHVPERLVLDTRDFSNLEVAVVGDGLQEEGEVTVEAASRDTKGSFEEVVALLVVLRVEQWALGGIDEGVDDGACAHFCIVLHRSDSVERGNGRRCCDSGSLHGFWRVPGDLEGEAVAALEAVVEALVAGHVFGEDGRDRRAAARVLLLEYGLLLDGGTLSLDGEQGGSIHTGAGAARHPARLKRSKSLV